MGERPVFICDEERLPKRIQADRVRAIGADVGTWVGWFL